MNFKSWLLGSLILLASLIVTPDVLAGGGQRLTATLQECSSSSCAHLTTYIIDNLDGYFDYSTVVNVVGLKTNTVYYGQVVGMPSSNRLIADFTNLPCNQYYLVHTLTGTQDAGPEGYLLSHVNCVGTPKITGFSKWNVKPGEQINIIGANFSPNIGDNRIFIDGVEQYLKGKAAWDGSMISFTIDTEITWKMFASHAVYVQTEQQGKTNTSYLYFSSPTQIYSITPQAYSGGTLTVKGKSFGAYQGSVLVLNSVQQFIKLATVNSWSDTQIGITLPENLVSGDYYLEVAGSNMSNRMKIKVLQPVKINQLFTASPNEITTINGENFGANYGMVQFRVNGKTFYGGMLISWSDTQIRVVVPQYLKSANNHTVQVIVRDGRRSEAKSYTVDSNLFYLKNVRYKPATYPFWKI